MPQPKSKAAVAMTRGHELKRESAARALPDRFEEGNFGNSRFNDGLASDEADQAREAVAYCPAHSKWKLRCKPTNIRHQMKILTIFLCAAVSACSISARISRRLSSGH
ncbi:hypothetical protein ACVWXQ_000195 [Bradyrhizobium sp. S3.14.4]